MLMISIHAAREGGDYKPFNVETLFVISIHAAREGGDYNRFNIVVIGKISIHAAREGGDLFPIKCLTLLCHFNPRRP